jgi:8-oxo-dGTP pyrophosphatase MutT (NUDIX family)
MFEQKALQHRIQKFIIGVLIHNKYARFSQLRPPKTDTNLFSYHLKVLIKEKWIDKTSDGYTLSKNGLMYVDRVSIEKLNIRSQPKIITMLLVQNSEGDVLVQQRTKQPYINTWTLPYGKTRLDDHSIEISARRESTEKLNYSPKTIRHAGDAYIRVKTDGELLSNTLVHIFRFETNDITETESIKWVQPLKLLRLNLAPAVEDIVSRSFFGDEHFFAEFSHNWVY